MDLPPDLAMWLKYPLILPMDNDEYRGFLPINGKEYKIKFKSTTRSKFKLDIDDSLKKFKSQIETIQDVGVKNPVDFLDGLVEILSKDHEPDEISHNPGVFRTIINEYAELRQFYINIRRASIAGDLKTVRIEQRDERNRAHKVTIATDFDGANLFRIAECDLPDFSDDTFEGTNSLSALYESFLGRVECPKTQIIFDIMDEIDRNCWVLDPETPTRKDLHRRVMLENNVSAVVRFDSNDVTNLPQIKFLGPQNRVQKYKDALHRNYEDWDSNGDVFSQLLKLLEIKSFMPKPTVSKEDEMLVDDGDCCICFSLRLGDKMPEIVCPNQACSRFFHTDCLYQWLCSLNSRKFYYEIYGQCPNCEKSIHCPLPSSK